MPTASGPRKPQGAQPADWARARPDPTGPGRGDEGERTLASPAAPEASGAGDAGKSGVVVRDVHTLAGGMGSEVAPAPEGEGERSGEVRDGALSSPGGNASEPAIQYATPAADSPEGGPEERLGSPASSRSGVGGEAASRAASREGGRRLGLRRRGRQEKGPGESRDAKEPKEPKPARVKYSLADGFVFSSSVGRSERAFYEAIDPVIRFFVFYFLWGRNKTVFDYICITLFVIAGSAAAIFGIFINAGLFDGPDAAGLILPMIGLICGGLILSSVQPVWPIGVFEMFFISLGAIIGLCGSPAGAALVSLGSEGFVASIGIAATIDEGSVRLTSILFTFVETVGSFMQYGFADFLSTVTDYFSGEGVQNLSAWLSLICIVPTLSLAVYNTFTLRNEEERQIEKDAIAKKKTKYRLKKQLGADTLLADESSDSSREAGRPVTFGAAAAIVEAVTHAPHSPLLSPAARDVANPVSEPQAGAHAASAASAAAAATTAAAAAKAFPGGLPATSAPPLASSIIMTSSISVAGQAGASGAAQGAPHALVASTGSLEVRNSSHLGGSASAKAKTVSHTSRPSRDSRGLTQGSGLGSLPDFVAGSTIGLPGVSTARPTGSSVEKSVEKSATATAAAAAPAASASLFAYGANLVSTASLASLASQPSLASAASTVSILDAAADISTNTSAAARAPHAVRARRGREAGGKASFISQAAPAPAMRSIVSENAYRGRAIAVPPDFDSLPAAGESEWFLVTEPGRGLDYATAGPCGSFFRRLIVPRSWYMWNVILILITVTMAKASLFNIIMVHSSEHYDPVAESVQYFEFWTLVAGVAIKIVLGLVIGTLGYDNLMEPRVLYKFFCVLCAMLVVALGFAVGSSIYTLVTDDLWGTGVIFIIVDAFNVIIQPLLLGEGELRLYLAVYNLLNYLMENVIWTICEPIHTHHPFAGEVTFICISLVLEIVFFLVMPWSTRWVHFSRAEENEDIVQLDTEALIAVNELMEKATGKPLISKVLLNAELRRREAKELGLPPPTFATRMLALFKRGRRSSDQSGSGAPGPGAERDAGLASGPGSERGSERTSLTWRRQRGPAGRVKRFRARNRRSGKASPGDAGAASGDSADTVDSVCCTPTSELLLTPVLPGSRNAGTRDSLRASGGPGDLDVPEDPEDLGDPGDRDISEPSGAFLHMAVPASADIAGETLPVSLSPE